MASGHGEGVSEGQVQSMIQSAVDPLSRRTEGVEQSVSGLQQELRALRSDVEKEFRSVWKKLGTLEEEIQEVRENLVALIREVRSSFQELNRSVSELTEVTLRGDEKIFSGIKDSSETTRKGLETVSSGIKDSEETSRRGLEKVSSGVAIVDMLKASSDAQEMAIAIEGSLGDVAARRSAAKAAVMEKRQAYDDAVREAYLGLEKQVRLIGKHIVEIQEHLERVLDKLRIDETDLEKFTNSVRGAQERVIRHRAEQLRKAFNAIDYMRLDQFHDFYAKLQALLTDDTLLRLEVPQDAGEDRSSIPAFGLPIIAVRRSGSGIEPETDVYCLEGTADSCEEKPVAPVELAPLTRTITNACKRLDPAKGVPVDDGTQDGIRAGLDTLVLHGLLRREHADLIREHLDRYPLHWMDS